VTKLPHMGTVVKPGPRERLLSAAMDLTYAYGMGVGVDAVLKEADVTMRSLYQHFGGKTACSIEVIRVTSAEDERFTRRPRIRRGRIS
jgi:AcrR family transcriptional regulator